MAERRMFAKTIIDSDSFLDMPLSTQSLYFHLSMRADDDGFINNPKKIQRMIGASDDDLKILIAKKFIITFESGIVVIKHWKIHNYIQRDRYKPTIYGEEKALLRQKKSKAYTLDTTCIQDASIEDTQCIQDASMSDTQDRLGKDRLGKDRLGKDIYMSNDASQGDAPASQTEPTPETKRENINYQEIIDMYNNTCISLPKVQTLNEPRRRAIRARLRFYGRDKIQQAFEKAENSNFLKGEDGKGFRASFDWLMKDANIAKVLDGNYDNFESKKIPPLVSSNKGERIAQELDESYRMMQEWATEREV